MREALFSDASRTLGGEMENLPSETRPRSVERGCEKAESGLAASRGIPVVLD